MRPDLGLIEAHLNQTLTEIRRHLAEFWQQALGDQTLPDEQREARGNKLLRVAGKAEKLAVTLNHLGLHTLGDHGFRIKYLGDVPIFKYVHKPYSEVPLLVLQETWLMALDRRLVASALPEGKARSEALKEAETYERRARALIFHASCS